MTQHLTTCCNAPYAIGGERTTHWYMCSACRKPTHQIREEATEEQLQEWEASIWVGHHGVE